MKFAERRTQLLTILLLTAVTMFSQLGEGNLPSWDDAYYAQKSKEMLMSGNIWVPTYNGEALYDNPPGFFWLEAISYKLFGVNEFGARFPSALAGLLSIFGVFFLFELLFSNRVGFLAALILNFTTVYLKYARHAMIDVSVACASVWCIYFFFKARKDLNPYFYILAGAIGGYCMAAKSFMGGVPLALLFVYVMVAGEWRVLLKWQLWLGLLLYFTPFTIWSLVEYSQHGHDFIQGHFISLLFNMASAKSDNDHVWDYGITLLKYFPIFLPFMFYGIYRGFTDRALPRQPRIFALVYFLFYFSVLSVQGITKTWYFMPVFPACAGLAALGVEPLLRKISDEKFNRGVAIFVFTLNLAFLIFPIKLGIPREVDIRHLAPYVRAAGEQGFKVYSYNNDFHGLNNALIFYSDMAAPVLNDAQMTESLSKPQHTAYVFANKDWAKFDGKYPYMRVIRRTDELILVADEPINQEAVFQ